MDYENRDKYREVLLNAYQSEILKIVWSTSGFAMAVAPEGMKIFPEMKEKDFREYVFSIIKLVIGLAENREMDEKDEDKLEIAKIIFEKEYDLKNHLYIKKSSKIECFTLLEYEIISHRNLENPTEIEATSAIIKIVTEEDDEENTYKFEVSRRDLEDMINQLDELKKKIDKV